MRLLSGYCSFKSGRKRLREVAVCKTFQIRLMTLFDGIVFQKILPVGFSQVFYMASQNFTRLDAPSSTIGSSVNTYNYNPASYLVGILQPILSTGQHTVKDPARFADWAKSCKHNNGIMCSFDVCSLFSNVPLDETKQFCLENLYASPDALNKNKNKPNEPVATVPKKYVIILLPYIGLHSVNLVLGPVHTNPFSNENGAVLLRIRLSSTLQRQKRSPKTEPFENALQSGAI